MRYQLKMLAVYALVIGVNNSGGSVSRSLMAAPQNTVKTPAGDHDELQKTASWNWPDVAIYEEQLLSYLDQKSSSEAVQKQVEEFWKGTEKADRGPELLEACSTWVG